ncbi:MAG TPA: hypothetical protein VFT44_05150 [Pyrinomonadaceae bacterium]|nr:hypothetical protein [Pyrinomonadaceae bacterium]
MNDNIKTFLFDWDGTLVDSAHLGLIAFGVRSAYPSCGRVMSAKPDLYLEQLAELLNHS